MFKKENLSAIIFVAVVILFVGLAVVGMFGKGSDSNSDVDVQFSWEEQPLLGNAESKVNIKVFGDYNCPHCINWDKEIAPLLYADYIETDKASMSFANYQFLAPSSVVAGKYGEVVHKMYPESFWNFHAGLFELANQSGLNEENMVSLAKAVVPDFNEDEFKKELKNDIYSKYVTSDKLQGESMNVVSTPTVFVNDIKIENGFDYERIQQVIESELTK